MHINSNLVGQGALFVSLICYLFYFFPQLIYNQRQKNARNISWGLHLLYLCGMNMDLIYGFGSNLAWQYKLVTIIGLVCLSIQHMQLCKNKPNPVTFSIVALIIFALGVIPTIASTKIPASDLNIIGMISQICWWSAFVPQIIKNYQIKSGDALAYSFILLTLSCSILDLVAATCLNWPYPSLISPPIMILMHSICLIQKIYYRKRILNNPKASYN